MKAPTPPSSPADRPALKRSGRTAVEYRVVSVVVRGNKARAIARLLELTAGATEREAA